MTEVKSKEWKFLIGLILLGALFRVCGLNLNSLWSDELTVWEVTRHRPFAEMFRFHMETDGSPPLYWILHYPFTFFTPEYAEWGTRSSAVIAGILSIPAVFFLAKKVLNSRSGLLAAALLSTAYVGIYFSQEARAYSLMILLSAVSSYFWFRIWDGEKSYKALLGYILSATALMYTHNYGILFIAGQGLLALCYFKRFGLKTLGIVGGGIFLLYAPWIQTFISQAEPKKFWMSAPEFMDVFAYHKFLFERSSGYAIVGTLLIIAAFVIGIRRYLKNKSMDSVIEKMILIILFGFIPFAIAFWRSRSAMPILHNRYMLIAYPGVITLVACSLEYLSQMLRARGRAFFTVFAVILIGLNFQNVFVRNDYYRTPQKDRNRERAQLLIEWKKQKKLEVVAAEKWPEFIDYYLVQMKSDIQYHYLLKATAEQMYEEFITKYHYDHFILSVDQAPAAVQSAFADYTMTDQTFLPRSIYIYEMKRK